ncbi:MAG TPA: bifunctional 5,10-methylenetetrahydrofolate dehydrogenase/5,10-methenyltetrahydrofolate cyclohydrolase, partial [Pirellulales bacterium]
MTAKLLNGKQLSEQMQGELAAEVAAFKSATGVTPTLAALLVGENPASEVYVRNKRLACERVGMASQLHRLPSSATTDEVLTLVRRLNESADPVVHGILVQTPLPPQVDSSQVLSAVSPLKDVDAFHPENVGLIAQGRPRFFPCTPYGIQQLLIRSGIETAGRHAVIIGRSDIVGKPMALMLMQRGPGGDATVTVCHSRTPNLDQITRQADILIVAIGRA